MASQTVYSVVVPCYNEQDCILETHRRLSLVMRGMGEPYEIVYVNDGSRDKTPEMLDELAAGDPAVRVVHFARNAGHQAAVSAGLRYASGQAVVIIDADLQDPPEVIPEMARMWKEGAQVVYGKRRAREGETAFKKWTAKAYYRLLRYLAGNAIPEDTGDFRLAAREVVDVVNAMPEHARFLRGMFAWAGFEQKPLVYDRDKRFAGETHYPLRKMLRLASHGVLSFSEKPLLWPLWLGLLWLAAGGVLLLVLLVSLIAGRGTLGLGTPVLLCLGFGSVLASLGVLGAYLARVYDEVKGRPLYVVSRTLGFDGDAPGAPPLPPSTRRRA
ncbi:MAG TPA: glycosyltransferase family 2 protein [Candidatus Limnocylindria bacterium]|nr:glycosyltransferase family 2 protein [Candidatus Limnocylindria bacterium]